MVRPALSSGVLLAVALMLLPRPGAAQQDSAGAPFAVAVDSARHEVVITAGPYHLPATGGAHAGHAEHDPAAMLNVNYRFVWPVEAMARGFHMDLRDAGGKKVSQRVVHHLQIINTSRRQLLLPLDEKIMAIGSETPNIMLPATIGMPLPAGIRMRLNIMWHNETATDIPAVYATLRIRYSPANLMPRPLPVLPLSMDVADMAGKPNTFRIPAGNSTIAREFRMPVDARLLGVSGHLHDWGTSLRLEEVESGKTVVAVHPPLDSLGRIRRMPVRLFGIMGDGIKLRANRRYRVIVEYHNPTGHPIDGAMGHLDGLISVSDLRRWPMVGTRDVAYLDDGAWKDQGMMDMMDMSMPMDMPMDHGDSAAAHSHPR